MSLIMLSSVCIAVDTVERCSQSIYTRKLALSQEAVRARQPSTMPDALNRFFLTFAYFVRR